MNALEDLLPKMGSVQGLVTWGITLLVILPLARNILAWATPSRMPIVNNRSLSDLFGTKARSKFAAHGRQIFDEAVRQFPLSPFQVYTDMGIMTILPPSMAVEVRNDPRLSVTKHTETVSQPPSPSMTSSTIRYMPIWGADRPKTFAPVFHGQIPRL